MEIAGMIELVFRFFIFGMSVFTITSAILYSELVSDLRDCWINYFKGVKNKQIAKLQFLGMCSLCLAFHIANVIQWLFLPIVGIQWYLGYTLAATGLTWILTSKVNSLQWNKVRNEQEYNRRDRLDKMHESIIHE